MEIDDEAVAILHQGVSRVRKLGLLPSALPGELRVGVGGRLVCLVAPLLTVEVHGEIAAIVRRRLVVVALLLEALERCPSLDERAVDREVLTAHKLRRARLRDDHPKELAGDIVREKTLAILREDRRNEALLDHVHVHEPAKEQVVVELLAELALAADRVERHQQRRLQQPLGRDRRPPELGIHRAEGRGELGQRRVSKLLDGSKRMVGRHPSLRRHEHQHRGLLGVRAAHVLNRSHRIAAVDPCAGVFQQPAARPPARGASRLTFGAEGVFEGSRAIDFDSGVISTGDVLDFVGCRNDSSSGQRSAASLFATYVSCAVASSSSPRAVTSRNATPRKASTASR